MSQDGSIVEGLHSGGCTGGPRRVDLVHALGAVSGRSYGDKPCGHAGQNGEEDKNSLKTDNIIKHWRFHTTDNTWHSSTQAYQFHHFRFVCYSDWQLALCPESSSMFFYNRNGGGWQGDLHRMINVGATQPRFLQEVTDSEPRFLEREPTLKALLHYGVCSLVLLVNYNIA